MERSGAAVFSLHLRMDSEDVPSDHLEQNVTDVAPISWNDGVLFRGDPLSLFVRDGTICIRFLRDTGGKAMELGTGNGRRWRGMARGI